MDDRPAEPGPPTAPEEEGFDRELLLSGRTRKRAPHLLFLVESWSDDPDRDVLGLLESTEVLRGLTREQLGDVLPLLEPRHVAAGETVVTEGRRSDGMFVIGYGRVRVSRRNDGRERVLAELGPGDTFGEWSLVTGDEASASVEAVRDSLLLRLDRAGLLRVTTWDPDVLVRLARRAVRLAASPHRPASGPRLHGTALAVVAAGPSPLPAGFVADLVGALGAHGPVLRVSSAFLDADLGEGTAQLPLQDARNGRVVEWLQRAERTHATVVYEADGGPTNWTRRCLRQADRVVRVAPSASAAGPNAVETDLLDGDRPETAARQELVLVHPAAETLPSGTGRWLSGRQVAAAHHVRAGVSGDHLRLARLVTGRAVGVVFGGGGARGMAHLGVARALEDAGIAIDVVGGTSIGSVTAFMCAMGWSHPERMERAAAFFSTRLVVQPTIPLVSLSSGRRLSRLIARETRGRSVEDLWLRYFSVSTNLSQATQVVHDRGDLATAVRASVSLPGILPPVRHGTDLLVDGGLLNNLPIDVMQEVMGGGRVIAVDLRREVELTMRAPVGPALSGWQVLARRLWRGPEPFDPPGIAAVLMRSVELAGRLNDRALLEGSGLDLYLCPPNGGLGTLDFKAAPGLVDQAYRYTVDRLAEEGWAGPEPARG
ncbi:MAG TPA: patatin-like phospholipase family protein [Acidimicrobiales bacterium]|nr:patatin-like phospholipase family protein [Acidimicrobiales bacterium]